MYVCHEGENIFCARDTFTLFLWDKPFLTVSFQVRNAQRSGASGVIIADNTCLCSDAECVAESDNPTCETSEPIMADDGSGSDISIPSFLMFKRDADKVKEQLMDDHPVQLEMAWSLPTPDDRVEYDLWTVPTDVVSRSFLQQFRPIAEKLGDRAYFTPHMYIYDGVRTHCQGNDGENFCYNLCTNNGRYCATDPDNDLEKGISGADVVKESLRRLCIWKHYGEQDGVGMIWWNYIEQFFNKCSSPDFFMNQDCVKDCYKHAGVDGDKIDRCMIDSGGTEKDVPNVFLDLEIAAQTERGVVVLPTAFVNTAPIRGQLSSNSIFHAICAGYAAGTTPKICEQCAACSDPTACVSSNGKCSGSYGGGGSPPGTVSSGTFSTSMLMVIAIFGGVGYWHYKKTRDDMRQQVRGILAEYMPLEDNDGDGGNPMSFASGPSTQQFMS